MQFDERVYRQLRSEVYGFAYRQLGDHATSEDVVQDSFVRLAGYAPDTIQNIGGMLRRIARNLIIDHARLRRRRGEEAVPDDFDMPCSQPSQEEVMVQRERVKAVSRIIEAMPPQRQQVFVLRRLHGLSAREVAARLDITPGAVDAHVARAVLALHRGMAAQDEHEAP